ncbi:MAG: hypothetical protein M1837_005553 [Sclerophora amabilis]|nr:MAG: hypothetical protein M1837_005553 [Sclerophora amabilis]
MSAQPSPGRPGNLTAEQEAILREFWVAVLQVFGVLAKQSLRNGAAGGNNSPVGEKPDVEDNANETGPTANTVNSEKKKRKRMSLFGKKGRKDSISDTPVPGDDTLNPIPSVPSSATEGDDKYGQTKAFKLALASQTPEDLRQAFWSMVKLDHPDGLLLRFLRARKWDVERALVMLVSAMHWRSQEMHVDDDIMKNGEGAALAATISDDVSVKREGEDFLTQLRMGKSFLHGVDKEGRPMCFVRVRLHKQGEQSEKSLEKVTVYTIETARLMLRAPIDTATIVFDMTGFSMANMDYAPVKFMIKCFEANYPESLGAVLVYKAPWVFQGIWSIIKGWLDPVVAGKVHFTKNVEELERFVPRNHIPKELGGDEDWAYQYIEPNQNENTKMADDTTQRNILSARVEIVKRFEEATLDWIGASSSEKTSSTEMATQRTKLASELRDNYWQIDPFTRSRSIYDRIGILREDGLLDFYPSPSKTNGDYSGKRAPKTVIETSQDDVD